jgi:hypothetical protein
MCFRVLLISMLIVISHKEVYNNTYLLPDGKDI